MVNLSGNNMTKEEIVISAIENILSSNIKLQPCSAAFRIKDDKIISCSGIGALMIRYGLIHDGAFKPGWYKELCSNMNTTPWWLWRFHIGFDIGNIVLRKVDEGKRARQAKVFAVSPDGKKIPLIEDEVSCLGLKLRKKYYGK